MPKQRRRRNQKRHLPYKTNDLLCKETLDTELENYMKSAYWNQKEGESTESEETLQTNGNDCSAVDKKGNVEAEGDSQSDDDVKETLHIATIHPRKDVRIVQNATSTLSVPLSVQTSKCLETTTTRGSEYTHFIHCTLQIAIQDVTNVLNRYTNERNSSVAQSQFESDFIHSEISWLLITLKMLKRLHSALFHSIKQSHGWTIDFILKGLVLPSTPLSSFVCLIRIRKIYAVMSDGLGILLDLLSLADPGTFNVLARSSLTKMYSDSRTVSCVGPLFLDFTTALDLIRSSRKIYNLYCDIHSGCPKYS